MTAHTAIVVTGEDAHEVTEVLCDCDIGRNHVRELDGTLYVDDYEEQ